jgi:flavin reductase (DIM6/NTAB) family NADH-FMN oxidoreductase RutF
LTGGATAAYHRTALPRATWQSLLRPTILMSKPGPTRDHARPAFTERQFRDALSEFATGVTIITTRDSGARYVGFTANSFNSVSLAPPLVLWSLSRAADSHLAFEQCERYAINVLAADQVPLARRFSRPHADRFSGVPYTLGWAGAPLIEGAAAWLECRHFSWQPVGDHTLFVGEVVHCARNAGSPLIFHNGRFETTAPLPPRSGGT